LFWLEFSQGTDTRTLAAEAARLGVLIEPGDVFFVAPGDAGVPTNYARLGFASIDAARIDPGIQTLAGALARVMSALPAR